MKEKTKDVSNSPLEKVDIIENGEFVANGKKYFLEPQISLERFKAMSQYEIEISFATSFKKLWKDLNDLRAMLNKAEFVDSAVKLRDIMEGLHRVNDARNHHPILWYCTLILNTEDEDRRAVDEKVMNDKIKDWEEAGIPISSFFELVLHTVNGLPGSLRDVILSTSEKNQTKS